jgi:hypothetical protein
MALKVAIIIILKKIIFSGGGLRAFQEDQAEAHHL